MTIATDDGPCCPRCFQNGWAACQKGTSKLNYIAMGYPPDVPHVGTSPVRTALLALVAADNCNYDRDAMRSEGLFEAARRALGDTQT